jgi:hypothetical protein
MKFRNLGNRSRKHLCTWDVHAFMYLSVIKLIPSYTAVHTCTSINTVVCAITHTLLFQCHLKCML